MIERGQAPSSAGFADGSEPYVVHREYDSAAAGTPKEQPATGRNLRLGGVPLGIVAGCGIAAPKADLYLLDAWCQADRGQPLEPCAVPITAKCSYSEVGGRPGGDSDAGADQRAASRDHARKTRQGGQRCLQRDFDPAQGDPKADMQQQATEDPHGREGLL